MWDRPWGFVRRRYVGLITTAVLAVATVSTLLVGAPRELPGVALGSGLILHVERVATVAFGALLVAVVLVRGWSGELPSEISNQGLKYADKEATTRFRDETTAALEALKDQAEIERSARLALAARVDALEGGE
jgi:hypothetical protein